MGMIFKLRSSFLIVLSLLVISVYAQPSIDSLKTLLASPDIKPGTKAGAYYKVADLYLNINRDSARYYAMRGLQIAEKHNDFPGIFNNSCVLGKVVLIGDSIAKAAGIFEDARLYLDDLDDQRDALCVLLLLGYAYDMMQEYYAAHEVLYEGLGIAETLGDSVFLWSYYNNIGNHYSGMEMYEKSIEYLKLALLVYHDLSEEQRKFSLASVYNNMGLAYMNLGLLDSAENYLGKALEVPGVRDNKYGMFNLLGNLGEIALKKAEYAQSVEYFDQAGNILEKFDETFEGAKMPLMATHFKNMGRVMFEMGNYAEAKEHLANALEYGKRSGDLAVQASAYNLLSIIYEKIGDKGLSLEYLRTYLQIKDSLDALKTDKKIINLTLRYEFEKDLQVQQQERVLSDLRHRRKEMVYLFSIITAGGLLVSLFLLFLLQRNKNRRKQLEQVAVRLEKEKISEELDYKNKELTTNVMYLLRKNEFINTISRKLNDVINKFDEEDSRVLKGIIGELDKAAGNDDIWHEFELRFKEVHTGFYNRLIQKFPGLTAQELRLCAFMKLNMTNKEIAAITFQSIDSLKTARYRLRKKLGMDRDENLVAYLARL